MYPIRNHSTKLKKEDVSNGMYADLHLHTNLSDGTFTPSQLIALAKKAGLDCISITDHDCVAAYLTDLPKQDIEIVPGIELTADVNNTEVHLLGYFIDYEAGWFQDKLKEICSSRVERMKEMCAKLTRLGMKLDYEEVVNVSGHSCVGRLHLARLMVKKGYVFGTQEAFDKYIGDGRPCYASKFRLSPKEAIALILEIKGVPVLAHPYSLANQDLIPEFVKSGLMGLEAIYPEHNPSQTKHYQRLSKEYGLLVTGGSDCHGEAKPQIRIGEIKIPYDLIEKLKAARH
jgi:predicted metal-dependent phosphoesterase TrpH